MMDKRVKVNVGDRFETNYGSCTVTYYGGHLKVHIEFDDGYTKVASTQALKNGKVKNPFYPNVCGKGYSGEGTYRVADYLNVYKKWHNMFRRCYDQRTLQLFPTYIGCKVAVRWHNFQNFCGDYFDMVGCNNGWDMDKDLLRKGNYLYSRHKCVLLPQHINKLLIKSDCKRGAYPIGVTKSDNKNLPYKALCNSVTKRIFLGNFKTVKEAYLTYKEFKENEIKRVALLYEKEIDPRAFEALMDYTVDIDD